jgi:hypothetical protein
MKHPAPLVGQAAETKNRFRPQRKETHSLRRRYTGLGRELLLVIGPSARDGRRQIRAPLPGPVPL